MRSLHSGSLAAGHLGVSDGQSASSSSSSVPVVDEDDSQLST